MVSEAPQNRYLPNSASCYVCGDTNPAGLGVRFELEGETVLCHFRASKHQAGYHGMVHGGVLSALLDETMGWAPSITDGRFSVCAELKVRFLRPSPLGRELTVRGWTVRQHGRLFLAEGEITDSEGTVYVKGWGKYSPLTREQTLEVVRHLQFQPDTVPRQELWPDAEA
ncbi:MAG TPA: PaaI family thioesterase [Armatimonadota bacterium]|jgi:uncharacterized protein (TIGR00369 family)